MKRLALAVIVILMLAALAATSCAEKESASPLPEDGQEVVSTCVTCHTDKDTLKEVATPEPEEVHSEATSGEG